MRNTQCGRFKPSWSAILALKFGLLQSKPEFFVLKGIKYWSDVLAEAPNVRAPFNAKSIFSLKATRQNRRFQIRSNRSHSISCRLSWQIENQNRWFGNNCQPNFANLAVDSLWVRLLDRFIWVLTTFSVKLLDENWKTGELYPRSVPKLSIGAHWPDFLLTHFIEFRIWNFWWQPGSMAHDRTKRTVYGPFDLLSIWWKKGHHWLCVDLGIKKIQSSGDEKNWGPVYRNSKLNWKKFLNRKIQSKDKLSKWWQGVWAVDCWIQILDQTVQSSNASSLNHSRCFSLKV